jgi:hypothetical protein
MRTTLININFILRKLCHDLSLPVAVSREVAKPLPFALIQEAQQVPGPGCQRSFEERQRGRWRTLTGTFTGWLVWIERTVLISGGRMAGGLRQWTYFSTAGGRRQKPSLGKQ